MPCTQDIGPRASVSPPPVRDLLFAVGASAALAFLAGMIEDFTKTGRITLRLVAPMLSGLVFCLLTGYAVTRVDIPFVDHVMALPFVAIAFTAFAMAGLTHAVNIIDGFDGLAAGNRDHRAGRIRRRFPQGGRSRHGIFLFRSCWCSVGVLVGEFSVSAIFSWEMGVPICSASSSFPWPSWFPCEIPMSPRGRAWSYWPIPCWRPRSRSPERSAEAAALSDRTDCICTC